MNMLNNNTWRTVGMVLGAVVLVAIAYFFIFIRHSGEYSVIYLSSGEVYVGRFSTFPRPKLTDGYIFQIATDPADPAKNTFQLSPLKDALWAPEYLYLNPDQILFSGPLEESSSIFQTLKNPTSATSAREQVPTTTTQ